MKTTIEFKGFEITIEELDNKIIVSAEKHGEVMEEFELESNNMVSKSHSKIKTMDEFEKEDEMDDDMDDDMEDDMEDEMEDDMDEMEDEMEEDEMEDEMEEDEMEDEMEDEKKLESFSAFIRKRK